MMASRWATSTRKAYVAWLDLAAHEFFHVWNVKRLRPAELGPFDYENENYTRSLWIAEGFTDYYSFLMVRRAGLVSEAEYLGLEDPSPHTLSGKIDEVQSAPGRLEQPVAMASFDAWIKFYRPNENRDNATISYYTKGALVGWLLDARIRRLTGSAKSLDDLMRLACARWSGEKGYTFEEFRSAAEEVAGAALDDFFRHTVFAAEELDYSEALDWFGLQFRVNPESENATLGVETKVDDGRILIKAILRTSPAWTSGLNVDDEIIAIDDYRVHNLAKRLENYHPGDNVALLVARRDALLRINLPLSAERNKWSLEVSASGTPEQSAHLKSWLSAPQS
jgi:predicted metalloprotease with PDZ domain